MAAAAVPDNFLPEEPPPREPGGLALPPREPHDDGNQEPYDDRHIAAWHRPNMQPGGHTAHCTLHLVMVEL